MQDNYYEPHIVPDPAKPFIFHSCQISRGCVPHWHENLELLYFHRSGRVVCNRNEYEVGAHDIVIFGSNTVHSVQLGDDNSYDCLIVDSKFCADSSIDVASLEFDCVVRDEEAEALFLRAVDEISRFDLSPSAFSAAGTKAAILALVVCLCRRHSHPISGTHDSDTVKRAIGYINSHISRPMSIDEIAGYVKVSKYYFCREFHRETGYTVVRYINNLRCREAERLLRQSEAPVGEIARSCGYDNLSYFTRTYKSIIGRTPSETRLTK